MRPRGLAWLAWIVVALVVGGILWLSAGADVPADPAGSRFVLEMQGKYLVGANEWPGVSGRMLAGQSGQLNYGPVEHRLCVVTLVGELAGPKQAAAQLAELLRTMDDHHLAPTERQQALIDTLDDLYTDYAAGSWSAPSLDDERRALLREDLGWFGDLALAPPPATDAAAREAVLAPANRTMIVVLVAAGLGLLLFLCGLVALGVFAVAALADRLHWRHVVVPHVGGVYAETFALWMVLFVALQIGVGVLLPNVPMVPAMIGVQALGLLALGWPLVRGVPWRQLREEIGLSGGPSEIGWGFLSYTATLPLLAIGMLLMLALMAIQMALTGPGDPFDPAQAGAHPIVGWLAKAGAVDRAMLVFVACVGAPITEEIFFRGLLYRHLREATRAWRLALSVIFSAGFSALVFAAIHPQGLVAVPVLGSLAFGFAVTREWRGSLLAPIVAHAINNGVVMTMVLLLA